LGCGAVNVAVVAIVVAIDAVAVGVAAIREGRLVDCVIQIGDARL
jgi:hypothetical protein